MTGVSSDSVNTKMHQIECTCTADIILTMVLRNATENSTMQLSKVQHGSVMLHSIVILSRTVDLYVLDNIMYDSINVVYVVSHVCCIFIDKLRLKNHKCTFNH